MRVDFAERAQDLLAGIGDWTTDPVVATTTYYQYLHWSSFKVWDGNSAVFGGNGYVGGTPKVFDQTLFNHGIRIVDTGAAVTTILYRRLWLPAPCTVVDVDVSCIVTAAGCAVAGEVLLLDTTTTTPTQTSLASRSLATGTTQGNYSLSSGANINQAILDTDKEFVFLKISLTSDGTTGVQFGFHGARVTYSRHPLVYV
jgi:hypothetical protein